MLAAIRRFGRLSVAMVAAVIGFLSSMLFGAFATYPYFPSIPGWDEYPEPMALTQEKLLFDGVLTLTVLVGIAVTLVLVRRLAATASLRASLHILTVSLTAWIVVFAWRLTGRDAIGTEADVSDLWLWVVFISGLVTLWLGLLAGAVELGIRPEVLRLRGRPVTPVTPRRLLLTRGLVVMGLMVWMWLSPWRTADRLELSVITTALCAIWLWRTTRNLPVAR